VLAAILSAARSTADLAALIRASPRLYHVFASARREVLLSIVASNLGPALRDAVAALLITPTKLHYPGDYGDAKSLYLDECERVIRRYEALPRGEGGLASASGLPMDAVLALLRLNRSVQYLIDEFAESRLPELRKKHPDAAGPLTAAERRRFARALLRHQVLARIEYGGCLLRVEAGEHLPRETAMMHRFLGLFRPWETEQLAEAHAFLEAMACRAFPPGRGVGWPRESDQPVTEWERKRDAAIYDLGNLHRALVVAERARATVAAAAEPGASRSRARWAGSMVLSARFQFLRAGPLPAQGGGSYYVASEFRGLRDELYRREDAMPALVYTDDEGDDDTAPPFAWVDAHGGLDCHRWGHQARREVLQEGQEDTTGRQRIWIREYLNQWRWLGFVFWDRTRVELLKTRMPVYGTGWLKTAPPSDDELRELRQKVLLSRPKPTRPEPTRPSRRANRVGGEAVKSFSSTGMSYE
jgi:hypothetical protein